MPSTTSIITAIKLVLAAPLLAFAMSAGVATMSAHAAPLHGVADIAQSKQNVCNGIVQAGGSCSPGAGTTLNKILRNIITILSGIIGVVAVIMVVVSGFRYVTSGGDTNKIAGAKNTLLYAVIGLVIVALAQLIVHFVLHTAGKQ